MFEVVLGTNKKFAATMVDERYSPLAGYTLAIDVTPTDKTVEEYVALFNEEGALSGTIKITLDGTDCATYTGYDTLTSASVRLADDGSKAASISLEKSK